MKGNFVVIILVVIGGLVLVVNFDWLEIDIVNLLCKWWLMGFVVFGIVLYFMLDDKGDCKVGQCWFCFRCFLLFLVVYCSSFFWSCCQVGFVCCCFSNSLFFR